MIIAAVDVSGSLDSCEKYYKDHVSRVLLKLKFPIRVILWNNRVVEQADIENEKGVGEILNFDPDCCTTPQCFIKVLPKKTPIELYIFTDGQIYEHDIVKCHSVLKNNKPQISRVSLHYLGLNKQDIELQFTTVFRDFPHEIFIQGEKIATVDPKTLLDFKDVDYEYIMKDNSFKARIIALIRDHDCDQVQLKAKVKTLMNSILKQRLQSDVKLSIREFYENKDISGCVNYIKKHSYNNEKVEFQRKMADIFKLFDANINTYAIETYESVAAEPELIVDEFENENEIQSEDGECLTCDVLYDVCDIVCIPIKMCSGGLWPTKNMIVNPFHILESKEWIKYILDRVEPFVLDFNKTYKNLRNPDISPFSRDSLKGVYVLHHPKLNADAVIRHNNYILSNFFMGAIPGKAVLWHVVFLYLVATLKFPQHKNVFFRDICFLCQRETYYISLTAHLNPPIVETLETCFWYVACVCPIAWPNNKKNVLRRSDFVSGKILDFYRDVYDPQYEYPKDMHLWKLWYALCREKTAIFQILSKYFRHERVAENDFGTILYRERLQPSEQPDLETVLKMYSLYRQDPNFYKDLSDICKTKLSKTEQMLLKDEWEPQYNTLDHVRINLETCHPYVFCQSSNKYWKNCVGKYNQMKESYVRLFKRYCIKYRKYPEKGTDLMVFLNEFIFDRTDIPELFDLNLPRFMDQVLQIFKEVVKNYPCKTYLHRNTVCYRELVRLNYE